MSMKRESLKQREHREGYNKIMGYIERNMADEVCEECFGDPCICDDDIERTRKLTEIRGGM